MQAFMYPQTAAALLRLSEVKNNIRQARRISSGFVRQGNFMASVQMDRFITEERARAGHIAAGLARGSYARF